MTNPLAACAALLLLAGCAGGPPPEPATDGGSAVILVTHDEAMPFPADRNSPPEAAIYADGTALVPGANDGALLTFRRRTLTPEEFGALFRQAAVARLFRNHRYEENEESDSDVLRVRMRTTAGAFTTVAVNSSKEDDDDRARVVAFREAAAVAGNDTGRFVPDRIAVLAIWDFDHDDDVRPWPLPMPLEQMPTVLIEPCVMLEGAQVAPVLAAAREATRDTRWRAGNKAQKLLFRPLLPEETDCRSLT